MSDQEVTYTIKGRIVAQDGEYLQTLEDANKRILELKRHIYNALATKERFKSEMHRWEAKFRQLKHENNQLRKALHQ